MDFENYQKLVLTTIKFVIPSAYIMGAQQFAIGDLQFFNNGRISLPFEKSGKSLNLVTSTLEVSPLWLVDVLANRIKEENPDSQTILVTFQNKTSLHEKGLRRQGTDLSIVKKASFTFMDLSQDLYTAQSTDFKHTTLETLLQKINSAIRKTSEDQDIKPSPPNIILENPDILLSSGNFTGLELAKFIYNIQKSAGCVYLFCNADEPLIDVDSPLGEEQSTFLTQVGHQSALAVSLRPLNTGRADDVTGVIRVSQGPRVVSGGFEATEGEYLYLVSGDNNNVKLFYR